MNSVELTLEEKKKLADRGYRDPVWFLNYFLPEQFPGRIPWVHRGILAIMLGRTDFLLQYGELDKIVRHFRYKEDPSDESAPWLPIFTIRFNEFGTPVAVDMVAKAFAMMMLPRGFSKTTLVGLGVSLMEIVYRECKFLAYISASGTHATMQLTALKRELEGNEKIILVFGVFKPERNDTLKWQEDYIETVTGVTVVARGRGGQIRGLNNSGQRPDRIIVDDLEDHESVATPEQRAKCKSWFYGDVIPALPPRDPTATIRVLATLLHREALPKVLENDPAWCCMTFPAIDLDGDPLWEEHMDLAKLEAKKRSYAAANDLEGYYLEYMLTVRAGEKAKFKGPFIIQPYVRDDFVSRALVIDPAISEKKDADFCALGAVGMTGKGQIVVLDAVGRKGMLPREQVDTYFALSEKWDCTHHGVESIAYQAALIHLLREEMFRKKRYFIITPITHTQKKVERVEGVLSARYANGYIHHVKHFPELETQLLDWPNGKKDFPDVIAMAVTLLDPFAASAGMEDGKDLGEDEMKPLDEELGDWRSAV